jgi:hypothetical protein
MPSTVHTDQLSIRISISNAIRFLVILIFSISLLSTFGYFSKYVLGHGRLLGLIYQFNLDKEGNFVTFLSAVLILIASLLLLIVAVSTKKKQGKFKYHWWFLSALFAYIAVDEASELHERLSDPVKETLGTISWFYFAWVIPVSLILVLLAILFYRFYLHLPRHTQTYFIIAASMYLGGALLVEIIGGRFAFQHGMDNLTFGLLSTFEETMELLGISIFIFALLKYIRQNISPTIEFRLRK